MSVCWHNGSETFWNLAEHIDSPETSKLNFGRWRLKLGASVGHCLLPLTMLWRRGGIHSTVCPLVAIFFIVPVSSVRILTASLYRIRFFCTKQAAKIFIVIISVILCSLSFSLWTHDLSFHDDHKSVQPLGLPLRTRGFLSRTSYGWFLFPCLSLRQLSVLSVSIVQAYCRELLNVC